jgi:RHH-type rel operon transcriptional repressor/antitoxin RelB
MLALRLPPEIEKRLDALAEKTGRTKSYYAREAILQHLADLENEFGIIERRKRTTRSREIAATRKAEKAT